MSNENSIGQRTEKEKTEEGDQPARSRFRPRMLAGRYHSGLDDDLSSNSTPPKANWAVLTISAALVLAIAIYTFIDVDSASATLWGINTYIATHLGWFYIFTATLTVAFVLVIALGRSGSIRLGPDHSRPKYSLFTWASMLFAAGIGVDLMFFSVAEPLTMYLQPPVGEPGTMQAAKDAVVFAMFHYGITGWAMYALMGMAFGYFAYRFNMPLAIRSALLPLFGKRMHGHLGDTVDIAAMLGTVCGIATSLGIGVVQLSYGIHLIFGFEDGLRLQSALVLIGVLAATISAVSGVDRGIRILSELNVFLAIGLAAYIVIAGKTAWLFDALIMNIGDYISSFASWTMDTYAFSPHPDITSGWMESWTLFFWAWWIAWAPFVGLFLARISRGRTLRQFVIGVLVFPFLFIVMWMSFFGNSALDRVINENDADLANTAIANPERGFYDLLATYPGASVLIVIATFCGLLLYITSADSGALVMANFTSKIKDSRQDGPRWSRILWSFIVGILTLAMLQINGIPALQAATVIMGLPFAFVIYLIMASLWKALRMEHYAVEARTNSMHAAMSSRVGSADGIETWRQRIRRSRSWPSKQETLDYINSTAQPALEELTQEFCAQGMDATLVTSIIPESNMPELDLQIFIEDEKPYRYQLFPVQVESPGFAHKEHADKDYYRLEVYTITGSLGYDVNGYTKDQLINNALDLFDRHLEFLHIQREEPGSSDVSDGAPVDRTWEEDAET